MRVPLRAGGAPGHARADAGASCRWHARPPGPSPAAYSALRSTPLYSALLRSTPLYSALLRYLAFPEDWRRDAGREDAPVRILRHCKNGVVRGEPTLSSGGRKRLQYGEVPGGGPVGERAACPSDRGDPAADNLFRAAVAGRHPGIVDEGKAVDARVREYRLMYILLVAAPADDRS